MKANQNLNPLFPETLQEKLNLRKRENALRSLKLTSEDVVDFSSNDYLGFSNKKIIADLALKKREEFKNESQSSSGSRLLTGNYAMIDKFETYLHAYYETEAATVFNSGYDANLGLLSSIGQRQDLILFDELSHASIRDGISLSKAKAYKFKHNDLEDLESKLSKFQHQFKTVYVVTEHVFSMDGDKSDVENIMSICQNYKAFFILDEAHAVGVLNRKGFNQESKAIFARVITFGKAFGSHGAVVLGPSDLKSYLINFAKSFIYTTAPTPETIAKNWAAHLHLEQSLEEFECLRSIIKYFKAEVQFKNLSSHFISSDSAIQSCVMRGNKKVKSISKHLQKEGFDVRPILSPTVPKGKERLRFCLHSFNTEEEISKCLSLLQTFIN
jgi:8-amino-7-oxononanoate synthase